MTWDALGLLLLVIAACGFGYQCWVFVRRILPQNYGSNPGFGCFEVMVMPWLVTGSAGTALAAQSWAWGIGVFVAGFFSSGFLATLLGRGFRKSARPPRS